MDDIRIKKLTDLQKDMMEIHDSLIDLIDLGGLKKQERELLEDALDSLGEAIGCVQESLE